MVKFWDHLLSGSHLQADINIIRDSTGLGGRDLGDQSIYIAFATTLFHSKNK